MNRKAAYGIWGLAKAERAQRGMVGWNADLTDVADFHRIWGLAKAERAQRGMVRWNADLADAADAADIRRYLGSHKGGKRYGWMERGSG